MEEYLTTKELSIRIKMAPGTIRNLVWKKSFLEGIHYVKPTGKNCSLSGAVAKHGSMDHLRIIQRPKASLTFN